MKQITFILISLTFCILIKAQIPQAPTNLQSPNAASLGLYGEVPVTLFTGIPEISIPIFTAPDKYNGFSIGLSYHGGGVRPDQHSGWVGTNWTLMAGGCITRVEKGGCDEIIVSGLYDGYYANPNVLNDYDLTKNNYLNYDTEPDEFAFSFGSYSGKFYFDRNKNLVVKCNKLIKATLIPGSFTVPDELKKGKPTSWVSTFNGFSIKTEDGTEYIFGGDQGKVEFNMEFWEQQTNQWYATAWYLAQIKYTNGKTIDFNYERGSMINQMYISKSNVTYSLYEDNNNGLANEEQMCSASSDSELDFGKYDGYLISPIYLTSISSPDFKIDFQSGYSYELRVSDEIYQTRLNKLTYANYGDNGCNSQCNFLPYLGDVNSVPTTSLIQSGLCWKALSVINIYSSTQLIKSYNLNYDYSNISSGGDPQYNANDRLFLMSVVQNDGGKYNFEYFNKQLLPKYLAEETDHWGFYNNKMAQYNSTDYNSTDYFASREPDSTAVKYGALKTITYPTGGTTEFIFEANQYSSQTKLNRWEGLDNYTSNRIAGGLRIKKIITTPLFGQTPTVKEYFYTKNYSPSEPDGLSSGILGGHIQYYFDNRNANADRNLAFGGSTGGSYKYSCFTTQSVLPVCTNSLGSHIGYSEVVEKLSDGSYTRYKFSNFDTGNLDEIGIASIQTESPYQAYDSKEQERGNLLSKQICDSNNIIKLSMINNYKKSDLGYINSIYGSSKFEKCPIELAGTYYTEATSYKIYTYEMLLDSTTTTYYNDNQQPTLTKIQNYKYNAFNQIIKTITHTSDGKELVKNTYYPADINGGLTPSIRIKDYSLLSNYLLSNNCLNPVIAEEQFLANKYIKGVYNDFTLSNTYYPLLNNVYLSNNDQSYRKVYECTQFDSKNNPLAIIQNDGLPIIYLWSYNYLYPIAEIKNATYAQVSGALQGLTPEQLSASANPDMSKVEALRTDPNLTGSMITTYTYNPLVGITSKTDPRGVTTRYAYDSFKRLGVVRDNNLNILGSYQYAYQTSGNTNTNSPLNANGIIKDGNTYYKMNNIADVSLTNGSGNFGYSWSLKNSTGTVLQSIDNSNSAQFNFVPTELGTLRLQCVVTDFLTNIQVAATKTVTCIYAPFAATITTESDTYASDARVGCTGCSTGTAKVTITGGSVNYLIMRWELIETNLPGNLPDIVLQSTSTGSSQQFVFHNTIAGSMKIQCTILDTTTGTYLTVYKNITVQ